MTSRRYHSTRAAVFAEGQAPDGRRIGGGQDEVGGLAGQDASHRPPHGEQGPDHDGQPDHSRTPVAEVVPSITPSCAEHGIAEREQERGLEALASGVERPRADGGHRDAAQPQHEWEDSAPFRPPTERAIEHHAKAGQVPAVLEHLETRKNVATIGSTIASP